MSEKHRLPEEILAYLNRPTPHALCLGLVAAPVFCLEAFTTEALLLADRESAQMLRSDLVRRLRAEIVRRHLTSPRTVEHFDRFEKFLRVHPDEAGPLLLAVQNELRSLKPRKSRPSGIWSESGQKFVRELLSEYQTRDSWVREAILPLHLPERESDDKRVRVFSAPVLVSIQKLIALFDPIVQGSFRRGLCIRLRIELDERDRQEHPTIRVEGTPNEDLARSAELALAQVQATKELHGRFFIHAPEVLHFVPIEGNSAALALYASLLEIAHGSHPPAEWGMTGALDPHSGRVGEVSDLEVKWAAGIEAGLEIVFYPGNGDAQECAVGIQERDPRRFVQEARRLSFPGHLLLGSISKVLLFIGLCLLAASSSRIGRLFFDAATGVSAWVGQGISPPLLRDAVIAAIGWPMAVLFFLEPFLLFFLIWGALSDQLECLVNWSKFRRWEPGLSAAGPTPPLLDRRRRRSVRVFRTSILFFLFWGCWIVAAGLGTVAFHGFKAIPKPGGSGWPTTLVQIGSVTGLFAVFGAILWGMGSGYDAVRRWLRRFPLLR